MGKKTKNEVMKRPTGAVKKEDVKRTGAAKKEEREVKKRPAGAVKKRPAGVVLAREEELVSQRRKREHARTLREYRKTVKYQCPPAKLGSVYGRVAFRVIVGMDKAWFRGPYRRTREEAEDDLQRARRCGTRKEMAAFVCGLRTAAAEKEAGFAEKEAGFEREEQQRRKRERARTMREYRKTVKYQRWWSIYRSTPKATAARKDYQKRRIRKHVAAPQRRHVDAAESVGDR